MNDPMFNENLGMSDSYNRCLGSLVGLAVGDAIGTTVEFKMRGEFPPVTDMVGGGVFQLKPGEWTDDTSMALCLATSLIKNGFDLEDQLDSYCWWYREGFLSSNGHCFDIGNATQWALRNYEQTGNVYSGSEDITSSGNGSIMRLCPVVIYNRDSYVTAMTQCEESSKTTHRSPLCIFACRYLGSVLFSAINGHSKHAILCDHGVPFDINFKSILTDEYKTKTESQIRSSGYVVDTLEAALWAFNRTDSFKEGLLKAVNLGDDADTVGAVYGQIAGAYYGYKGIPAEWVSKIKYISEVEAIGEYLFRKKYE